MLQSAHELRLALKHSPCLQGTQIWKQAATHSRQKQDTVVRSL